MKGLLVCETARCSADRLKHCSRLDYAAETDDKGTGWYLRSMFGKETAETVPRCRRMEGKMAAGLATAVEVSGQKRELH